MRIWEFAEALSVTGVSSFNKVVVVGRDPTQSKRYSQAPANSPLKNVLYALTQSDDMKALQTKSQSNRRD